MASPQAPWYGRPEEWAGFFLFAVGLYGATYRALTRNLTIWGVVPLDWLYEALLLVGIFLLLRFSPQSPFYAYHAPAQGWRRGWRWVRGALVLALATLVIVLVRLY